MGLISFLDTNVVLFELRGLLAESLPKGRIFVSVVSEIEILSYGALSLQEESDIRGLLSTFTIVPLDEAIKQETIRLRRQVKLRLPDAIILASASVIKAELLTNDADLIAKASIPCRSLKTGTF